MSETRTTPTRPRPTTAHAAPALRRPFLDPHAARNQRRAIAVVATAVLTVLAGALAIVSTVGYDHQPDFVNVVHGDDRLKEFTRLSDREINEIAREVCVGLEQGSSTFETADALTAELGLTGVAGTTFVSAAVDHSCPEHSGA